MPSFAPRPVATISVAGTARPSAHGQAMISTLHTACAIVPQVLRRFPSMRRAPDKPRDRREQRDAQHRRHENRRDLVGQPLHWGLARLGVLDEFHDLRQSRFTADFASRERSARHPELIVPPMTSSPTFRVTGSGSPLIIDSSMLDLPEITTPSIGTRSPGRIRT